jgi:hypothetical protein
MCNEVPRPSVQGRWRDECAGGECVGDEVTTTADIAKQDLDIKLNVMW